MSMIRCEGSSNGCCELIDSDADPECFVEVGNMRRLHSTKVLCVACRDEREAEIERGMNVDPEREFSPEQQAIVDAAYDEADDRDPTP